MSAERSPSQIREEILQNLINKESGLRESFKVIRNVLEEQAQCADLGLPPEELTDISIEGHRYIESFGMGWKKDGAEAGIMLSPTGAGDMFNVIEKDDLIRVRLELRARDSRREVEKIYGRGVICKPGEIAKSSSMQQQLREHVSEGLPRLASDLQNIAEILRKDGSFRF